VFDISLDVIENHPDHVKDLIVDLIIIRAECLYAENVIRYTAISDKLFDNVKVGYQTPKYQIIRKENKIIANRLE